MLVDDIKQELQGLQPEILEDSDYSKTGYHLNITVPANKIEALSKFLDFKDFYVEDVTAVDLKPEMEVIYHFAHHRKLCRLIVRIRTPRENPEVPTISHIYPGADWHERETHDFFGVEFTGHPNLKPLLLPEDADFHPLLKEEGKLKEAKDVQPGGPEEEAKPKEAAGEKVPAKSEPAVKAEAETKPQTDVKTEEGTA